MMDELQLIKDYLPTIVAYTTFAAFLFTIKSDTKETKKDLLNHIATVSEAFKGVHQRQDKTNGRIETAENEHNLLVKDVIELQVREKIRGEREVEDRSNEFKHG